MAVTAIAEEEHAPRLRLLPTPPEVEPEPKPPSGWSFPTKETVAVLTAISAILAVRLILLVAVMVGGYLAYLSVRTPSFASIAAAATYYVTVVGSLVYLTVRKG